MIIDDDLGETNRNNMKISSTKSSKADLDDYIVFCYHLKSFSYQTLWQDLWHKALHNKRSNQSFLTSFNSNLIAYSAMSQSLQGFHFDCLVGLWRGDDGD